MKIFILVLLLSMGLNILWAQISNPVNVSIELGGMGQMISISNSAVDLAFNTASDYENGVHSGTATHDHLTVGSSSGFQVVVSATGDLSNGSYTIPLNSITVTPSDGSQISGIIAEYIPTIGGLSTTDKTIIKSVHGAPTAKFNIDYFARDEVSYLSAVNNPGQSPYSTTVTYGILPY